MSDVAELPRREGAGLVQAESLDLGPDVPAVVAGLDLRRRELPDVAGVIETGRVCNGAREECGEVLLRVGGA